VKQNEIPWFMRPKGFIRPNSETLEMARPQYKNRRFNRYPKKGSFSKRQVYKRRATSRRSYKKTWLDTIRDPCNVKGVKVPDDHVFPTKTMQIKILRYIGNPGTSATGSRVLEINPLDVRFSLVPADGTSYSGLLVDGPVAAGSPGAIGATTWYKGTDQDGEADVQVLHQSASQLRIVSACVKAHYIGDADKGGGLVIGGILRGDSYISNAAATGTILAADTLEDSSDSKTHALREGVEVKWVPSTKRDTEFRPIEADDGTNVVWTDRNESTGMFVMMRGAETTASVNLLRLAIYINVEYIPKHGISGGTAPARHSSKQMADVGSFSTSPDNFVTPVDGTSSSFYNYTIGVAKKHGGYLVDHSLKTAINYFVDNPRYLLEAPQYIREYVQYWRGV